MPNSDEGPVGQKGVKKSVDASTAPYSAQEQTPLRCDVLIVGLGPVGAILASLLARQGMHVAAFDKLPDLYPLPRAIGLDHEAMRLLQQLQLIDQISPYIAPYRASEYRGADGQPILRLDAASEPYPLGWVPGYVFNQPALEKCVRGYLTSLPTAQMFTEAEVLDTGQDEAGVWADVAFKDGEVRRYHASYLVACDGGSSPIRKRLQIPFEDLGFEESWLVVDAIVPDAKLGDLPQTQVQYCNPERPATFVVGPGNHRRWEIMLHESEAGEASWPDHKLWAMLDRWVKPGEIQLWRSAAYRFHGLVAQQWQEGRILLAGDAAHMTPPFMAQGMVQGLRDAQNLAWKLLRVLRGQSHPRLLSSYMHERRPHTIRTTQATIELGRIICERDPDKARTRDQELLARQGGVVKTSVRQNLIPPLSAGLIDLKRPGHGCLFPQPRVFSQDKEVLLDDLTGCCFRLAVRGPLTDNDLQRLAPMLQPLGAWLVHLGSGMEQPGVLHVRECAPLLEPWMEALDARFVLVRPDHYVYGSAATMDDALLMLEDFSRQLYHYHRADFTSHA